MHTYKDVMHTYKINVPLRVEYTLTKLYIHEQSWLHTYLESSMYLLTI